VKSNSNKILFGMAAMLFASSTLADDAQSEATTTGVTAGAAAVAAASTADPLAALVAMKALSTEQLGEQRAKAKIEVDELTINVPKQDGIVAGNSATGNATGANSIAADAFVNAEGLINAVQNTGNNVLIQSSTIINVSVQP
jgi:hypothetical protein